jgi:hypothetical protein
LVEEAGRIKGMTDSDAVRFGYDFSVKLRDPVYVHWLKNKIKYEVMASPNEK